MLRLGVRGEVALRGGGGRAPSPGVGGGRLLLSLDLSAVISQDIPRRHLGDFVKVEIAIAA